ncbi:MAG: septal ring lytic transglycosylase RlpA family protein [Candidatus Sericytochromatia bacterium]|nr:septal ring lytic transglycosylase RlpA family protein [Candidatus Sericytochromatia bacterium]
MLIKLARLIMILVFTVSMLSSPVYAGKASHLSIGFIGNNKVAYVTINDNNVITIKAEKNVSPLEKTKKIAENLNKLLYNKQLRADKILPAIRGNNFIVRSGDNTLFTVDKNLAKSANGSPANVAIKWANSIRVALGARPLGYQVSRSLAVRADRNSQYGYASWYGPGFQGRPTSSGEAYDMNKFTAAHRTFPLGTPLLVTNMSTGRSVMVRVNDRGPYADTAHRVIDLSGAAFRSIASLNSGVIKIKIDVIK